MSNIPGLWFPACFLQLPVSRFLIYGLEFLNRDVRLRISILWTQTRDVLVLPGSNIVIPGFGPPT